jgi:hypothetical protein
MLTLLHGSRPQPGPAGSLMRVFTAMKHAADTAYCHN